MPRRNRPVSKRGSSAASGRGPGGGGAGGGFIAPAPQHGQRADPGGRSGWGDAATTGGGRYWFDDRDEMLQGGGQRLRPDATHTYGANGERHPVEDRLWQALCRAGLARWFERNSRIAQYEVDLVARRQGLVVEVDGFFHLGRVAQQLDQHKEESLARLGYRVLRVTNDEVRFSPDQVVNRIRAHLQPSAGRPQGVPGSRPPLSRRPQAKP